MYRLTTRRSRIIVLAVAALCLQLCMPGSRPIAHAATTLTITPITWNVVGLDSNNVTVGPNTYPVAARVCNSGSTPATNVVTTFNWDNTSAYTSTGVITSAYLSLSDAPTITTTTLAAGGCADVYYTVTVARTAAAYDTTRPYYITASADLVPMVSTPRPRELYVKHLISQARNSVASITGPTTVYVGQTVHYVVNSATATQGYEQLFDFVPFPNTIFRTLAISSTYTAPAGATNDKVYADACGWDNVPTSPTYLSCIGPATYGGNAGGTIQTTYTLQVVGAGVATVSGTVNDHSGASYHYNSDYGSSTTSLSVTAVQSSTATSTPANTATSTPTSTATSTPTSTATSTSASAATSTATSAGTPTDTATNTSVSAATSTPTDTATSTSPPTDTPTHTPTSTATRAPPSTSTPTHTVVPPTDTATSAPTDTATSAPTTTATSTNTPTTTLTPSTDLAVTDVTGATTPPLGSTVTFTVTATNNGPDDATGVTVQDALPSGLTYVSSTGGSYDSSSGAWTVSALANGMTSALTIVARVTRTGMMTTTATISGDQSDPVSGNNTAHASVTGQPSADLFVTSVDAVPSPATAGQDMTYVTTFGNNGPSVAANAVLTMTVPTGASFVSADGGVLFSCPNPSNNQGPVVCTAANMPVASNDVAHLTVHVPASTPVNTTLSSQSTITSDTPDPDSTNNSALGSSGVQTSADLSVGVTFSPHPVVAGQDITYTTTLSNTGPSDAAAPVVTTTIPTSTTFVSLTWPNGWNCATPSPGSGGTISCTLNGGGSLAVGGSATFALVVLADQGMPAGTGTGLSATSTASSTTTDPIAANNTATANPNATTSADLGVTNSLAPNAVLAGQTLTDTVTVTNHGSSAAAGAAYTETIPANTTFQDLMPPAGWTCVTPESGSTGTVSCTLTGVGFAAGASAHFTLTLNVPANVLDGSSISATATTGSRTNDPNQTNNASTSQATVSTVADLAVSDAASPSPVVAGQDVTYTATLTNTGPSDAVSPVVTLTIPTSTTFVSLAAPNGWSCGVPNASGVVTCTALTLATGQTVAFRLVVRVDPSTSDGVTLTSVTGASAATTDPNLSNNTASAGARVVVRADLQMTNIVVPTPMLPGQTVTYRAAFSNAGPSDARGVVFTEIVPAAATFVAVTAPDGWACAPLTMNGTTTVSCTASTLDVSATGTIALSVRVDPDATGGTILTAASTISSATGDPVASNNSSAALVTVLQAPPTATPAPSNAPTATPAPTSAPTATPTSAPTATPTSAPTPADTATAPPALPTHTPMSTTDITLAPSSTTRYVRIPDTLTVLVTRDGAPAPSLPVTCRVISGPDTGLVMPVMTDAHGHASCSFTSRKVGTDTVVASVTDVTVAHASNLVRVQWTPAGSPCSVQADLLTGPVLTHAPAYHGRLIDGALGRGRCAAVAALAAPRSAGQARTQARSAAPSPSACTQGWAAVSSYDYTITGPTGAVMRTPRLAGHVLPGDTIQASFTIKPRPARCATVRVSLASYAAPSLANNARALSQQVLYQSATGLFGAGAHNLALRVDVPARPLAVPSSVRPHIAGVRARGTRVFHHRARRSVHARSSRPTKGHRRGA